MNLLAAFLIVFYLLSALHLTQINGRAKSSEFRNWIRIAIRVSSFKLLFLWVLERDSFVSGGQVKTAHHAQLNFLINNYAARCWVFSVAIKVLN